MKKNKKTFIAIILIVTVCIAISLFALKFVNATMEGEIISTKPNIRACTTDVPPSMCGPYELRFKPLDGEEIILYAPGWNKHEEASQSQEIAPKIEEAKEQNRLVRITVNEDSEITTLH